MSRKAFHLLLKKYLDGKCSPQERELIDQWYELLDDDVLLTQQKEDLSVVEDRIWQRIQANAVMHEQTNQKKKRLLFAIPNFYKLAAAAFILIAGVYLFTGQISRTKTAFIQPSSGLPQSPDFYTKTNQTKAVLTIELEDRSLMQLQPNASVAYPKKFAPDKREVYLNGAASFKVTKNPARPFLVYTGTIVTQVLGTSFTIQKAGSHFEVTVVTGKVAVYEEGNKKLHDKGGVVITPNEKATYYEDNHHFITSLVDNPVIVKKEDDSVIIKQPFLFDETPLANIITLLKETYAVEIITENEKINNCSFSGNLTGQSLYNMLDVICQAIGANYEIRGTHIILLGNGCK